MLDDLWRMQVAAALAARHIGGAVNYVGVAGALDIPASAQAAGLAADNLLCVLYFSCIFQLARRLPPDPPASPAASAAAGRGGEAPQQRPAMQACAPAPALICLLSLFDDFLCCSAALPWYPVPASARACAGA